MLKHRQEQFATNFKNKTQRVVSKANFESPRNGRGIKIAPQSLKLSALLHQVQGKTKPNKTRMII